MDDKEFETKICNYFNNEVPEPNQKILEELNLRKKNTKLVRNQMGVILSLLGVTKQRFKYFYITYKYSSLCFMYFKHKCEYIRKCNIDNHIISVRNRVSEY